MTKTKELKNCVDDMTKNVWRCEREHNASGFRNHEILRLTAEIGYKIQSVTDDDMTTAKKIFKYLCDFHDTHNARKINLTALDMDSRTAELIKADLAKQTAKTDNTVKTDATPYIKAFKDALKDAEKQKVFPTAEQVKAKIEAQPEAVREALYKAFLPEAQPKSDAISVSF